MQQEVVQPRGKSAILGARIMSASAIPVYEPINPLDLANRLGIEVGVLALAVGADSQTLIQNPRKTGHDDQLRVVSDMWKNLVVLTGDEKRARLFLRCDRPELGNVSPLSCLEQGDPGSVLDLVIAMRELLP